MVKKAASTVKHGIPKGRVVECLAPGTSVADCLKAAQLLFQDMFGREHRGLAKELQFQWESPNSLCIAFPPECISPATAGDIDYFLSFLKSAMPTAERIEPELWPEQGLRLAHKKDVLEPLVSGINSAVGKWDASRTRPRSEQTLSQSIFGALHAPVEIMGR